jgi:two-component sensor histidine kinase
MKHGKAQKVNIRFESNQPGFIEIVAEDDGKGLPRQFNPGLGSQLLDEIAFPWTLEKLPEGGTILRARIPVSGKN